ncbi:MAG: hypothetical protein HY731_09305 [Candidatus Tectomicrobia bacterium]|nr:hypothetical protein [Candidatus Tectomicrobia bacterium]
MMEEEVTLLEWEVHLWSRERRSKGALVFLFLSVVLGYIYVTFGNLLSSLLAAGLFFISLKEYFFPMRYRLTTRGAYRTLLFSTTFLHWESVKKCYVDDEGIKLSVLESPSFLERYRGLYLYWGEKKDELQTLVRQLYHGSRGESSNL